MPSSSSCASTRCAMSCVAPTASATSTSLLSRRKPISRRGTRRAPGPVEAPIASRPRSTSASSCASARPCRAPARGCAVRARSPRGPRASAPRGGPLRSISATPRRCSSARTACDTADCVTPSDSAACENDPRSTTAHERCELARVHRLRPEQRRPAARCRRGAGWRSSRARARWPPARRPRWPGARPRPARSSSHSGEIGERRRAHELLVVRALDLLGVLEEPLVQLLARAGCR